MKQGMKFQANKRKVPNYLTQQLSNQAWPPLEHLKIKIL
jgi:hypothetical protein